LRARHSSNWKKEEHTWILQSQHSQRYRTGQLWSHSKAIFNLLRQYGVLEAWDEFFGEQSNLLASNLVTLNCLNAMHQFCILLSQNFGSGHDDAILGAVLLELCKFCA
jgi:hypothetical protein